MAAWAVFVLLAGGLAGYVVVYSDSAEAPQESPRDEAAGKDGDSGEEPADAASKPSLAVAGEEASPAAETEVTDSQPGQAAPADESDGKPLQDTAAPSETSESIDAAAVDMPLQEAEEVSEASVPDAMKPVAAKAEVDDPARPEPEGDKQVSAEESAAETPNPPPVPVQDTEESEEAEATEAVAAAPTRTEDARAAKTSEGETQVAFRAPQPAPAKKDEPPWQRYAAYFLDEDTRPRVAIIMTGLGMSDGITEAAIKTLPPEVTLSFSPYARNLASWIGLARVNGHEVLLDLYMEPSTYPLDDPGPQAIMTVLSEEENRKRFNWVLSRGNSYVGLTGRLGSRLLTRRRSLSPVMQDIAERGLLFVDDRATAGSLGYGMAQDLNIPTAYSEGLIDEPSANRTAIDAKLNRIERIALSKGAAVALAQPYPVTIERLNTWIEELSSRGVALAPITAVVNRQPPM